MLLVDVVTWVWIIGLFAVWMDWLLLVSANWLLFLLVLCD